MNGVRDVAREFRPQVMLVQGDTASVFFSSLVGFFERIPVGHVEAGLRSHDKWRPYPEEIFRRLTGVSADLHFAPTGEARENLLRENVPESQVFLTGNTVVDALRAVTDRSLPVQSAELRGAIESRRPFVLITAHRRESFGAPMREAFGAIRELADRHSDALFFYPVHPNPEVQRAAREILAGHDSIVLTKPLEYFDLIAALRHAHFALTDSGGIQEEAPTFGTPVLVMRDVTERPEGVRAGIAQLVGTDHDKIVHLGSALLTGSLRRQMTNAANPYGDGRASERIADIVVSHVTGTPRHTSDWDA
jgi:UDP-N-acetylglucosamine 2-epimerase (non-hydrolysing)